jgi:hypothetical protein
MQILNTASKDRFALGCLATMTVWFCQDLIFGDKIPFFRDLASYFYPIKFSVADAFKTGQLPLWDTHMAGGFPILAEFQSAVFYPPTVLYYLLPFFSAIQASYVFHFSIAAAGSYVLLRSWKYPCHVCTLGAMLFAFGGTTVSLSNLLNHFQSAVWLPWVIYCWERAVETKRRPAVVVFSVISLCQLLAGSPEIFLLSMGLVLMDTIRISGSKGSRTLWWNVALLGAAGLLITALAMVQLLPTAELVLQSRRDQAIPISEALSWSLRPSSLIGLVLPMVEPDAELSSGVRFLFADGLPFLISKYVGSVVIFGLCSWFVDARTKERLYFTAVLGLSLLCAFGNHTPIYPFLYQWVPVFRTIRFPEKFYYLTFVLLTFAAVRGLHVLTGRETSRATWIIASAIPIGWTITYVTFRWDPNLLLYWMETLQLGQITPNASTIAAVLFGLEKQIAVSTILAAILLLHSLKFLRRGLLKALLVLVVFVDLSVTNKPLLFARDKSVIQEAARIVEKSSSHGRIFYYPPGNNLHPSFVRVIGNLSYKKGLEIAFNNLLPNAGILYGFEYFQDIDALGRRSYTDFLMFINSLPAERRGKLLRALNVKHVVAFHALEVKDLDLVQQFPEHYSALYEVVDAVPRTYIVNRAIFDPEVKTTLERMASDGFEPLREVILDAPVQVELKNSFHGSATIRRYENSRVLIDARLSDAGVLVLTDAFYPGWKVFIDGKEGAIRRANYLFRGVELPAGAHQVEFIYDPLSFKIGFLISLLTAIFLVAIPSVRTIRRRRILEHPAQGVSHQPVRNPVA